MSRRQGAEGFKSNKKARKQAKKDNQRIKNTKNGTGRKRHIFISVLTLYEFEYALANSPTHKKAEIKATIQQIQQDVIVLPLSPTAAEIFGDLKKLFKELRKINPENLKKHTIDLMIAASALEYKTVLVSADKIYNDIHFLNVGLEVEDWTI